jgi:hypothetical protein
MGRLFLCGYRVMLMNDEPLVAVFPKSHGKTEFQISLFSQFHMAAVSNGCKKSNVFACGNLGLFKAEFNGSGLTGKEEFPGLHIGVQASRDKWERDIVHQHIGCMIRANSGKVFGSNCAHPSRKQVVDFGFWT